MGDSATPQPGLSIGIGNGGQACGQIPQPVGSDATSRYTSSEWSWIGGQCADNCCELIARLLVGRNPHILGHRSLLC